MILFQGYVFECMNFLMRISYRFLICIMLCYYVLLYYGYCSTRQPYVLTYHVLIYVTIDWHPVANASEVLGVDSRYLRAGDELRRIFGSKVINAVERSGEGGGMLSGRKRQPPRRGARGLFKKTLLVTPLEHWPRPEGGLSMVCTDTKEGLNFFRWVLSYALSVSSCF